MCADAERNRTRNLRSLASAGNFPRLMGPMTAKLCHLAICKLPSISRCGTSARGPTIYRTALRLPELRASPDTPEQAEPAKCQKWPPSSPESATGQPPKCGNEASWAGGQNAQLRGHWAGIGAPVGLDPAAAQERVPEVVRQGDAIPAEFAQRDGALDAAKALPVLRLRRRLLEQIGRQTRPVHDRPRVDMLAIDGAVEALDQPVASGHIRHERDDVDAELWRPVTPKRLEDGYGVDPPHANATLTQRNVALDPPRERPDDLLGVWRAPSLDADEDARPLTPHVVEALGQQVPLVVGEPVRSGEPAGPRDGGVRHQRLESRQRGS